MVDRPEMTAGFTAKAKLAAAEVFACATWSGAADVVLGLLQDCGPRLDLLSGSQILEKTVAMPGLCPDLARLLEARLAGQARIVNSGLQNCVGGLDVGLATAKAGVAESGTCLLDCADREIRLATMLPEISVILLREADIYPDLRALAGYLRNALQASNHLTMITGPSRTADIERVLTLGAHGPLRLAILLFADWPAS